MKKYAESPWKSAPISCTCEVVLSRTAGGGLILCDKAATHAYPAMGNGWMSLCARHALKHIKYGGAVSTEELIKRGERWA